MKKMKLSAKAVLSLVLSAVLFCMPGLGFAMNGNYACGNSLPSVKKIPINQRFLRFWKKNGCVFLFP